MLTSLVSSAFVVFRWFCRFSLSKVSSVETDKMKVVVFSSFFAVEFVITRLATENSVSR